MFCLAYTSSNVSVSGQTYCTQLYVHTCNVSHTGLNWGGDIGHTEASLQPGRALPQRAGCTVNMDVTSVETVALLFDVDLSQSVGKPTGEGYVCAEN